MKCLRFLLIPLLLAGWGCTAVAGGAGGASEEGASAPGRFTQVGGANSPQPGRPPQLSIPTRDVQAGEFAVRIPFGEYTAPRGGAPNYSVPGPVVAFRGPDGVWRGHGYLETYPRLVRFQGRQVEADGAGQVFELAYLFENEKSYRVRLTIPEGGRAVLIDEISDLGPRNVYVFDAFYHWQPASGFAIDQTGRNHAFLYLPCYYDKPEATINPAAALAAMEADADAPRHYPAAAVVTSDRLDTRDVAGFWVRDAAAWRDGDTMGIQLWQRRQLPGDPGSRHFQGPETKSDSTPNPRTAGLLGPSLYEGHVTIEMNLGTGTRRLGFAVAPKGAGEQLPEPFKAVVQDHLR